MPDGSGDAVIPALPSHLQRVPGFITLEDDQWRHDWFAWRPEAIQFRHDVFDAAEHDLGFQANERALCASDPKYWMAVWGMVYEPRARKAQSKHVPFTPFAFQCHFVDWLVSIADDPEQSDGLADKSRGIGLSWSIVAFAVWGWAFHDTTTLLLSRTQSEVDKPNNMNTLFGKALYLIDKMPDWLLPKDFNRDRDRTQMNIYNPETAAQIFGDSTTGDAGRGDRATVSFVDEAPFIRSFKQTWATLGGTTDHRVALGSMSIEMGFDWYNNVRDRRRDDPESVFTLDWWLNPFQDRAWQQREYTRRELDNDLANYYCEIERDPWRGRTNLIYPEAQEIVYDGPPYDPTLPVIVGYDPGTVDDTALIFGQPQNGDHRTGIVNWLDSYERSGMAAEFYAILLTGLYDELEPGDLYYGYRWSPREIDLMDWTRTLPWHRYRVVMDPAGKQIDSGLNSTYLRVFTFGKTLRKRWLEGQQTEHRKAFDTLPRLRPLEIYCEKIIALNAHVPRHNAARELLARSTWHDTPGTRRLGNALQTYRKGTLTAKATREPVPIHDDDASHLATAFEWVGVSRGAGHMRFATSKPTPPPIAEWHPIGVSV